MTEVNDPRLVLHIGAHKTGSSAIQEYLNLANPQLMKQGWVFGPQPDGPVNWSPMIGLDLAPGGGRFHLRREVYPTFLRRIRSRKRHLIVSAEDLFFLEPEQIDVMARDITPMAPDITIVAYLRRQDLMAMSQWAQGGKTIQSAAVFGSEDSMLRKLTPQMRAYLDYEARLSQWQEAFPKARIIARVYDRRAFPGGDVVKDFLDLLDLPAPDTTAPLEVNAALGTTTVQFMYWLRAQGLRQPEIWSILQRQVIEVTRDRAMPARSEALALLDAFADSNRRLAARMGVDQAFDMDLSDYPELSTFRPLPDDVKLRNLMALVLSMRDQLK